MSKSTKFGAESSPILWKFRGKIKILITYIFRLWNLQLPVDHGVEAPRAQINKFFLLVFVLQNVVVLVLTIKSWGFQDISAVHAKPHNDFILFTGAL